MKTKYFLWVLFMAVSIFTQSVSAQGYELFGVSTKGGETASGAIYRFDENGNTSLVSSLIRAAGQYPTGMLCKASNGKVYGMATPGGKYGGGVMFEFDPVTGNYIKKLDFGVEESGEMFPRGPRGSLMQAKNGKLYGISHQFSNPPVGNL